MTGGDIVRRCAELVESGEPCVLVTLVEATGSTPQDTGAKMVVTSGGLDSGTVGGGRVEAKAIELACELLSTNTTGCTWVDWNLKADVGMTCGGRVKVLFEPFGPSAWQIVVFGAGHVAQSLARLLATLPCQVTCIDPRSDWLDRLPPVVRRVQLDSPANYVAEIPAGAYVLCMTKGHRSDLPVLEQLFQTKRSLSFLGVIGSKAKASVLKKDLVQAGIDADQIHFHCPVGLPIGTNHPGEIAVSIAAQLLSTRDALAEAANE